MGWGGKEEVRVDKWAMVLRGKNVDLGRRQSPRLFECKYEDLRRGKGAYVTYVSIPTFCFSLKK